MTPRELWAAKRGHDLLIRDEWERVRVLSYYSVVAMNGTKQIKQPKDLFLHPWESSPIPKNIVGGREFLTREQYKEWAASVGIHYTETQLDMICKK